MNKFTEGPWHIVPKEAPLSGDGVVCELDLLSIRPADGVKLAQEGYDASLIAAAPEMLEALEDIIQRNEIQHWFNVDKARAAVAKAKGKDDE